MRKVFALCGILLLEGCSNQLRGADVPDFEVAFACPHAYEWTMAQIQQLGREDEVLPENSMAHRAIREDGDLRAQIRADKFCNKGESA